MLADGAAFHISASRMGRGYFHICLSMCRLDDGINAHAAHINVKINAFDAYSYLRLHEPKNILRLNCFL